MKLVPPKISTLLGFCMKYQSPIHIGQSKFKTAQSNHFSYSSATVIAKDSTMEFSYCVLGYEWQIVLLMSWSSISVFEWSLFRRYISRSIIPNTFYAFYIALRSFSSFVTNSSFKMSTLLCRFTFSFFIFSFQVKSFENSIQKSFWEEFLHSLSYLPLYSFFYISSILIFDFQFLSCESMSNSYLFCLHSPEFIIIRQMSSYFAEWLLHAVPPFSELLFLSAPTEMAMSVTNPVPSASPRRIIEQREARQRTKLKIQVENGVLDARDRETVYQLHVIMREQRKIFKVEEVKRKLKTVLRRLVLKTCGCCGRSVMKHKCAHSLCSQQTCSKYLRLLKYARRKLEEAQGSERQVSQRGADEDDNNSLNEEDLEEDDTLKQPLQYPEPLAVQEQSEQEQEESILGLNDQQIQ